MEAWRCLDNSAVDFPDRPASVQPISARGHLRLQKSVNNIHEERNGDPYSQEQYTRGEER